MTNMIGLLFLLIVAYSCRLIIITPKRAASTKTNTNPDSSAAKGVNWHALHTAVNITLFPPLFFFSGLYYTDVLSTCLVLLTYRHFLHTQDTRPKIGLVQPPTCQVFKQGFKRGVGLYSLGIFALLMRQTNIFWVAVFLAGQDIVSAFHAHQPPTDIDTEPGVAHDAIVKACGRGAIRDPKLADVDSAYGRLF
jgi:alpha-1,2-glucosyltransferase